MRSLYNKVNFVIQISQNLFLSPFYFLPEFPTQVVHFFYPKKKSKYSTQYYGVFC